MRKLILISGLILLGLILVTGCQQVEEIKPVDVYGKAPVQVDGPLVQGESATDQGGSPMSSQPVEWLYFFKGNTQDDLRFASSRTGTDWYGGNVLGNGAKTDRSSSAVLFNGEYYVFYRGKSTHKIFMSKSTDGVNWTGNSAIMDLKLKKGPTAVVFNGKMYLFFLGKTTGGKLQVTSSADGITWAQSEELFPGIASSSSNGGWTRVPPAAVVKDGRLFIFYADDSSDPTGIKGAIMSRSTTNGSTWDNAVIFTNSLTNRGLNAVSFEPSTYPSLTDEKVYVVYKDKSSNEVTILKIPTTTTGELDDNNAQVNAIITAKTSDRPAIGRSLCLGTLAVIYKGENSNNIFRAHTFDGDTWAGDVQAIGQTDEGIGMVVKE